MRVGVVLSPSGDWPAILEATRMAEASGLDAVGLVDYFHSMGPDRTQICGWTAYGALALATTTIRLVPMVLNGPNYPLGVLAKETSVMSIVSQDRFELGIGAGDFPPQDEAWGQPMRDGPTRVALLEETVAVLRQLWQGTRVTFHGTQVQLVDAACAPVPPHPPRVVVGAGSSRLLIRSAVRYADEINVYADEKLLDDARKMIAASGRPVALSALRFFGGYAQGQSWPADLRGELAKWEAQGVERLFVNIGPGADPRRRVAEIAAAV